MYEIISTPAPEAPVVDCTFDEGTGHLVLHRLERDGLTRIGEYSSARDAWAALDEIDAPLAA